MAAKAFLEQYMDCMDALPLDLQRFASQYWELDIKNQSLIDEATHVHAESPSILTEDATTKDKRKWLIQLQRLMQSMTEIGSEKLEVTSQMLDTVEGYSQQLTLAEKEMDNCRTRDELTGSTRNSSSNSAHSHKNPSSSLPVLIEAVERKKAERNQKRARVQEKVEDEDTPPANTATKEVRRESTSTVPNVLPSPTPSSSPSTGPLKPPKKKVKTKKRSSIVKEQHPSVQAVPAAMPAPDFTTEPIDPDEPTYCLCNQVSFGEMIGCDNDDCQIEWFHFQCVGLTAKPKGKWYCPQCLPERSKHRTSKT